MRAFFKHYPNATREEAIRAWNAQKVQRRPVVSDNASFMPDAVIRRLKSEPLVFKFCHKNGDFDDYYAIVFDPGENLFAVTVHTSVSDGRDNEQSHEVLSEPDLVKKFEAVHATGQIAFVTYQRQ